MSDAFSTYFWPGLFTFLGILVVQIPLIIAALKSNKKTNAISDKLDENTKLTAEVQEVAKRSHHEVTSAFMAGKREGYVGGIAEGKKQASGPMPLGK